MLEQILPNLEDVVLTDVLLLVELAALVGVQQTQEFLIQQREDLELRTLSPEERLETIDAYIAGTAMDSQPQPGPALAGGVPSTERFSNDTHIPMTTQL